MGLSPLGRRPGREACPRSEDHKHSTGIQRRTSNIQSDTRGSEKGFHLGVACVRMGEGSRQGWKAHLPSQGTSQGDTCLFRRARTVHGAHPPTPTSVVIHM